MRTINDDDDDNEDDDEDDDDDDDDEFFGVTVSWYKQSRRLLLSTYSTVKICWQHSTLPHLSSQLLSVLLVPKFERGSLDPNQPPFRVNFSCLASTWANLYQRTKFEASKQAFSEVLAKMAKK